ncbi:protein turtle homolog A-like [Homarus americanus]|uniref:protein turtle homolog A-like n=1 Tax=Homarus americanus TaxID=6706 RepID=UPI001C44FA96|nr:protein turtle homolog A-like [Homarus americanus]XP_042212871.1 protein turtle homolog A-like [Homarus americanus]
MSRIRSQESLQKMISRGRNPWALCLAAYLSPFVLVGFILGLVLLPMEALGTEYVVGVAGGRAELPCHMHTDEPRDRATLALWYLQGNRLPVYSYDARGESGLFQPDKVLGGRGSFETSASPARLILNPVLAKDQGIYTCRVDFLTSPTHNTVVNLTVIEPPEKLVIYNSDNGVVRHKIGPINEGTPLRLSCVVMGGRPPPSVTWWSERVLEERDYELTREGHVKSDLFIEEVTRTHHEKTYSCQAQNNKQQKLVEEVTIEMNLRPLSVRIKVGDEPLIAGRQYTFTCESQGSKPEALIKWFEEKGEVDVMRTHTRSSPGEITTGSMIIVPSQHDDGKILKCQASNPSVPGSAISDSVSLKVHYAPIVVLEMGRNLVPSSIKQGDDVYFECRVTANPDPYKISWEKNREEVKANQTAGVILSGNSLVLQQVERSSAGEYTCSATNTQGTQLSNPVTLDIMYPPECMVDKPTVLAVGRGERVNISCRVASNPARATFHWRLNGSVNTYTSKGEPMQWGHLVSHYTFLGTSDKDYGMLHCWANNSIGVQDSPCVFQIIPAGPPSSPEHCEIINNTAENIEVFCEHGFDGGMRQLFLAEVYDERGSLHLNRSSEEPQFSVESLQPGTTYTIRISAFNDKGRSPPIVLTAVTLKVAEQRVGENKSLLYSPLIIIFLSIVGVFLSLILILVFVTRWRKNYSSSTASTAVTSQATDPPPDHSTQDRPGKEEVEPKKAKPKKKVVVIENGTKDRIGLGDVSVDVTSTKDALLGRHTDSQTLANGSAGYYNSLGKTSFPSTFPSSSSCTLPRPQRNPTTTSSTTLPHHAHTSLTATTNVHLPEETYSPYSRYSETLPRNYGRGPRDLEDYRSDSYRGGGLGGGVGGGYRRSTSGNLAPESYRGSVNISSESYLGVESGVLGESYRSGGVGGGRGRVLGESYHSGGGGGANIGQDTYHQVGGGGVDHYHVGSGGGVETTYRDGGATRTGKDKYHLLEELKNNPKYVVRTRAGEPNDESFV